MAIFNVRIIKRFWCYVELERYTIHMYIMRRKPTSKTNWHNSISKVDCIIQFMCVCVSHVCMIISASTHFYLQCSDILPSLLCVVQKCKEVENGELPPNNCIIICNVNASIQSYSTACSNVRSLFLSLNSMVRCLFICMFARCCCCRWVSFVFFNFFNECEYCDFFLL